MSESIGELGSKRIQFHIDAATSLPLPKSHSRKAPIAYVCVKITNVRDRLETSVVKGQMNPTWQQNLTPTRISETSQVTFEVKQRSVWPKPTTSRLAITDPYPLSTLLQMQGGNTFGTNIELPLHAEKTSGIAALGILSVNIRELSSIETARRSWELAEKMAENVAKIDGIQQPETQVLVSASG
ncbi:hypothetical protein C8R43DRAFT_995124 [Mycena crocata]|nr:hypothetical protein C8R43DRAFT_995124 [Mycena crocata]